MDFILKYITNVTTPATTTPATTTTATTTTKDRITVVLYSDYDKIQEIVIPKSNNKTVTINQPIIIFNDTIIKIFLTDSDNNISQLYTSLSPQIINNNLTLYKTSVNYKTKFIDLHSYLSEIFINQKCYEIYNDIHITLFLSQIQSNQHINIQKIIIKPGCIYYPYTNQIFYKNIGLNIPDKSIEFETNNNIDTIKAPFDSIIRKKVNDSADILFTPHYSSQKVIYMPFSGKLVGYYEDGNNTIMEFINNYFMPQNVHERDLVSVHNGNFTYSGVGVGIGNRNNPQKILPQPNTNMSFILEFGCCIGKDNIARKDFYYSGDIIAYNSNCPVLFKPSRNFYYLNKLVENCDTYIIRGDTVAILM